MFCLARISINGLLSALLVGAIFMIASLSGCAIEKHFAGFRVTSKDIETGTEKVAVRVTSCVDPRGFVLCERRYGALTECSLKCKTPPNQWIERPVGYGGYEERDFTRYILTLQSPSGVVKQVQTSHDQYRQVSVGQVLGEAPTESIAEDTSGSKHTEAKDSAAASTTPIAATSPTQPLPSKPTVAMPLADAQRKLAKLGFDPGPADGVAGPKTSRALREFQASRRISVSGQLDLATIEELGR